MKMCPIVIVVVCSLFAGGCTSSTESNRGKAGVTGLGVAQEEVVEIERLAAERHRLVVVVVQKNDDGAIAVYLADKVEARHGIVVFFRKKDGRWQEDLKLEGEWVN
jgi:hypothetical protein